MAASWIIGYWAGSREPTSILEPAESRLDDASLTLLALLLAFAFGTAMARHEQLRLMVIADANAIGDFYICASLLNEPVRTQLQTRIREYFGAYDGNYIIDTARHHLAHQSGYTTTIEARGVTLGASSGSPLIQA